MSCWTKTKTVVGGPAAWTNPEALLSLGFDGVVSGEADYPEAIENTLNLEPMSILRLPSPPNLDHVLPPVRRWSYMYESYLQGKRISTMFTSRGCPMQCAFCESGRLGTLWGKKVRFEPMDVIDQQLYQILAGGFRGVQFYDDVLPLKKDRMYQIMVLLQKYNFVWRCFLRSDFILKNGGYEYLRDMADAGLVEVLVGVESASNRIKQNIGKGTTIEQDTEVLSYCKKLNINYKASLILGLPGETRVSMEATRSWILKHKPDRVDINTLIPMPGTPLTRDVANYDCYWTESVPEEFWYKGPRDDLTCLVGTEALAPEEIADFRNKLQAEINIPY